MPVYNEEELLNKNLLKIYNFFEINNFDFQLIIVESGSTDNSLNYIKKIINNKSNIELIIQNKKMGWGNAIIEGYKSCNKKYISVISIDLPFDLNEYISNYNSVIQNDVILSFRSVDDRVIFRKMLSYLHERFVQILFRVQFKSINSQFKIIKNEIINSFVFFDNHWMHELEILLNIHFKKLDYLEVSSKIKDRELGKSSVSFFDPFKVFFKILKIRLLIFLNQINFK